MFWIVQPYDYLVLAWLGVVLASAMWPETHFLAGTVNVGPGQRYTWSGQRPVWASGWRIATFGITRPTKISRCRGWWLDADP